MLLRNWGMYLKDLGLEPYIPIVKTPEGRTPYILHIYTKEELHRFFAAIEECPDPGSSSRKIVDAVLFRFLYGTGVRISEALGLKIADYDRNAGVATIHHGKNNRDRLIEGVKLIKWDGGENSGTVCLWDEPAGHLGADQESVRCGHLAGAGK